MVSLRSLRTSGSQSAVLDQPFQGGEILNEDWLFQPSKNSKSEQMM